MLLILTLTGAALLVLNVAIIACFVRRRSVNRSASGESGDGRGVGWKRGGRVLRVERVVRVDRERGRGRVFMAETGEGRG